MIKKAHNRSRTPKNTAPIVAKQLQVILVLDSQGIAE